MPIRYAIASGSYHNPAIWDSGLGVPTASDEVYANNRAVTITGSIQAIRLSSLNTGSAVTGGSFIVTGSGITITADIVGSNTTSSAASNYTVHATGSGTNLTVIGNVTGSRGNGIGSYALYFNSFTTGTLIGNAISAGSITGVGSQTNAYTMGSVGLFYMTGSLFYTGGASSFDWVLVTTGITSSGGGAFISGTIDIRTGAGGAGNSAVIYASGDVNFTGVVSQSVNAACNALFIVNAAAPRTYNFIFTQFTWGGASNNITIYGNNQFATINYNVVNTIRSTGGGTSHWFGPFGTWNIYGDFNAGNLTGPILRLLGSSTNLKYNIYGNIRAGSVSLARGMLIDQSNTNTTGSIYGNIYGGTSNGTSYDSWATGLDVRTGTNSILKGEIVAIKDSATIDPAITSITGGTRTIIKKAVCSSTSVNSSWPVFGYVSFLNTAPEFTILKENNSTVTLADPTLQNPPSASDVRDGVSYAFGSYTGTLKVPPTSAVSYGVAVDNTTGSAIITATDLFNAISGSSNDVAVRLRNVSTVQTTGDQFQAVF